MSLCYNDLIVCSLSRLLKELRELPIRALKETLKQFVAPLKESGTLGRIRKSEIGLQMGKSERAIGRVKEETKDKKCLRLVALYIYSDPKNYFDAP